MKYKMNTRSKLLAFLLCLGVCLSILPITALAAEGDTVVTEYSVGDYAALKSTIDNINTAGSGEYHIILTNDIVIVEDTLNALTLNKPVTVTLLGSGHSITGTGKTNMLSVQGGATLVLGAADETDVLVLDANEKGYGIAVTKGTLKMYEGVTIRNTKANGQGGVYVYGENAGFYMYGGTITACHVTSTGGNGGGGISARGGATLEITKGTITGCSAGKSGGGIWIDGDASANIRNAVIANNATNPNVTSGWSYWGAGICIGNTSGPVTIEKCQIINNKANGYFGGGIAILNDSKKITIDSCLITGNSCWRYGGGVALLGYEVNESEGIIISNSTITGNTAGYFGGGIANLSNKLTLQNTAVYANPADLAGDDFVSFLNWTGDFEYVSTTLCAVPGGLTLTQDGKEVSITGWYEDGNNTLGAEGASLCWGDEYNGGYYCIEIPVPTAPITTDIALKAAYDLNDSHDHVYENWTSNSDGTHTGYCNVDGCNATKTDDCSGGTATCTTLAQCSVCGGTYGSTDSTNHADHGTELKNQKEATCAADGYTGDTCCKGCGNVLEQGRVLTDSTNHADYGTELKNQKDATCTADGYTGDTCCKGCGVLLEAGNVIPGGHSFGTDWTYDENDHWHTCTVCDEPDSKNNHVYGDWVVIKEASAEEEGSREKTCACGYKIVESIAKTEPSDDPQTGESKPSDDPQTGESKPSDNPQTGDNSNRVLGFGLAIFSFYAIVGLTVYDKKKRAQV